MSASKKSNSKSTKSSTPATKPAITPAAAQPVVAPKVVAPVTPVGAAKKTVSSAPVAAAVAVKAVQPKPAVTTITARVDVGFGNALFIRGEGPGLSWTKGVQMECAGRDLWSVSLSESARGYTFKVLLNDEVWSKGPDLNAACGTSVTLSPEF